MLGIVLTLFVTFSEETITLLLGKVVCGHCVLSIYSVDITNVRLVFTIKFISPLLISKRIYLYAISNCNLCLRFDILPDIS